jgi:hypothetical protein
MLMKMMVIREKAPDVRETISITDVLKRIPISRSTLEHNVKDGAFPKMYSIAPTRVLSRRRNWQSPRSVQVKCGRSY